MRNRAPKDPSNGYEQASSQFIARRGALNVGSEAVRAWARSLPPRSTVLDLGCGSGVPIAEVLVAEGHVVYGIDASPSMIAAFRARFPDAAAACEAVEDSSFFGRRFDAVIAWGLVFLLDPDTQVTLLSRIASAIEPGGRLLFTAPRDQCEWVDVLTGNRSWSLGKGEYRRVAEGAGLRLDDEGDDEGQNHYYFMRKPAP